MMSDFILTVPKGDKNDQPLQLGVVVQEMKKRLFTSVGDGPRVRERP